MLISVTPYRYADPPPSPRPPPVQPLVQVVARHVVAFAGVLFLGASSERDPFEFGPAHAIGMFVVATLAAARR